MAYDLAGLRTALDEARRVSAYKASVFNLIGGTVNRYTGHIWDLWEQSPHAGASPSTINGTQYSKSTQGAIALGTNTSAGSTYALADVQTSATWTPANETTPPYIFAGGSEYYVHVWDRIWANAFSQNTTARQAITFPALTRYTTGQGLSIWLRWLYTFTTPTATITVEYTNQAGVSRTVSWVNNPNINNCYHEMSAFPIPLLAGDSGVQAVNAITLSAGAPDGPANAFSLMVVRYLGAYRVNSSTFPDFTAGQSFMGGLPQFDGNACLCLGIQTGPAAVFRAGLGPSTIMPQVGFEAKVLAL